MDRRAAVASRRMKALWKDPEFRAERSRAASIRLKALWATPSFVDKQMRALVRNWKKPAYRHRQMAAIRDGRRPRPLERQPDGDACPQCDRRGPHQYHVQVTGAAEDGSLRVRGWE